MTHETHAPPTRMSSVLMASARVRLVGALLLVGVLWAAVAWALVGQP